LYRVDLDVAFHELAEYARIMEDQIERLANADRLRLKRTPLEDEVEWEVAIAEHRRLFQTVLSRTFVYSCVVALFTLTETSLKYLCELLWKRDALRDSPQKYYEKEWSKDQSFVEFWLKYIKTEAKLDSSHPFVVKIKNLNKIRNQITHSDGKVGNDQEHEKLKAAMKDWEGFAIGHREIKISKGACPLAIQQTHEWLDHLFTTCGYAKSNG
jgi:hypothetical protein